MRDATRLGVALTGDALVTRGIVQDAGEPMRLLYRLIRAQDVAFTNIEVVPNGFRGYPAEIGGSHLVASPAVLDQLLACGFDLFSTANNHAGDYGIEGLLATLGELESRGMVHAGIGRDLGEARMPAYLQRAGGTVSLVACSSSFVPGQDALPPRPAVQGRPGLNPLRFDTVHELPGEQLEAIRRIASDLGLERYRLDRIRKGFAHPPADPQTVMLDKLAFRSGPKAATRTSPRASDLAEILRWVAEARRRSDVVIVSVHSHERGETDEDPPEFLPAFCRAAVEAGADIVAGHGPHLLRGLEIHRGRPIFYSLGNFFGQSDLVSRFAADVHRRYRVPDEAMPSDVVNARTQDDTRSFPAERRYWETVVPICRFEEGRLAGIAIHPVALGFGLPVHRRGLPWLAQGEEGAAILARFAALSRPFGTRIAVRDGVAEVALA